jgi:ADP-heptose:LPS heptosyltransferase
MEPAIYPSLDVIDAPLVTQAADIHGCIDNAEGGILRGWAFDAHTPDSPLILEVYEASLLVASGLADKLRSDVASAGFGNGFSGFEVPIPRPFFDGLTHIFEIRALSGDASHWSLGEISVTLPASAQIVEAAEVPFSLIEPVVSEPGEVFEDESHHALEQIKSSYIEDLLSKALVRIDELENSERGLLNERDLLRHQVAALNDHLGRELRAFSAAPHRVAPGDFDGTGVKTSSITRRRDVWLNHLSWHAVTGPVFALCPHDGRFGPLAILICGSGGIGDALYLTTVIRETSLLFPSANIFVLHENRRAADVFRFNPYVTDTICLEGDKLRSFVRACHEIDIFDLVLDVRYAVTYSLPPLSRIPLEFVRTASYRSAEWQKYVRYRWPHLNNMFAQEVVRRGMSKLDLVGWTSMLPISGASELDFFIEFTNHNEYRELSGRPYITIHHGADPRMSGLSGLQTKNLPIRIWAEIVPKLAKAGFAVAQIGETNEELVPGVDFDLRGRTSLDRTAYILKSASAHLDTEGGLVHLARTVNTPSVVAFGPTPVGFFGYSQNVNIPPLVCGSCWWTTDQWSVECPRMLPEPECMSMHSPKVLAAEAIRSARMSQRTFEIRSITSAAMDGEAGCLDGLLAGESTQTASGAIVLGWGRRIDQIEDLCPAIGEVTCFALGTHYRSARQSLGHLGLVKSYSRGNFPVNSGKFSWVVGLGFGVGADVDATVSTITDLGRSLCADGKLYIIVDADEHNKTPAAVIARLVDTNATRPGNRFILRTGIDLKIKAAGTVSALPSSYLLEIREAAKEPPALKAKTKPVLMVRSMEGKVSSAPVPVTEAKAKTVAAKVAAAPVKRGTKKGATTALDIMMKAPPPSPVIEPELTMPKVTSAAKAQTVAEKPVPTRRPKKSR